MRGQRRPVPADFVRIAPTMGIKALVRHYQSGESTVQRWIREAGVTPLIREQRRPLPADFAAKAATMTVTRLGKHYRTNARAVARWLAEVGIEPRRYERTRAIPVPADFETRAAGMVRLGLCQLYGVHYKTVDRWFKVTGLTPYSRPAAPKPEKPARPIRTRARPAVRLAAHRSFAGPKSAFVNALHRDGTAEGQAADHLRRVTRAAIYRCTEKGGVVDCKARLTHWRYGNAVLTPEELVARAVRWGFDPDEWRRVAA